MPACSVYGCTNNSGIHRSVGYYAFPDRNRNPSQYFKWLSCTRLKDSGVMTRNTRVCGKHFIESDFCESDLLKRRIMKDEKFRSPRLKHNALPSKFLGKGENPFSDKVSKKHFNAKWELLYMCQDFDTHSKCLICYESLKVKKYNIQKHYQNKHGHDYDKLGGEERSEALKRLQLKCAAFLSNPENKFLPPSQEKSREDGKRGLCASFPEPEEREMEDNPDEVQIQKEETSDKMLEIDETVHDLKEVSTHNSVHDFETLGQFVADQLKQLPTIAVLELQSQIMRLITTRRIQLLNTRKC